MVPWKKTVLFVVCKAEVTRRFLINVTPDDKTSRWYGEKFQKTLPDYGTKQWCIS